MKIFTFLFLSSLTTYINASDPIVGKWRDKNANWEIYEFNSNQDFKYEYSRISSGLTKIGVWELGSWKIAKPNGSKEECGLMIYVDGAECCFEYKFIAGNLVMSVKHVASSSSSFLCGNKVLVKNWYD